MTYWIIPLCGIAAALCLFALRLRQERGVLPLAILLGGVFAFLGAKILNLALEWRQWGYDRGLAPVWDLRAASFCFVGGCVGACLGIWLAARLQKRNTGRVLDAFAPAGALIIASFRAAEFFTGLLGAGGYVKDGALLARFPFSVTNQWGEHYVAVFTFEAAWALGVMLWALLQKQRTLDARPGWVFGWAAWLLASAQLFLEDLRAQGMMVGFVHTEQALCGIICVLLCAAACRRARLRWPVWAVVGGLVLIGLTEFGRQKANSAFLSQWGYLFIAVECALLAILYGKAASKQS